MGSSLVVSTLIETRTYSKNFCERHKVFVKAWIALFVCLSTKAIHLELVSNLTTKCFLDALTRFVCRLS